MAKSKLEKLKAFVKLKFDVGVDVTSFKRTRAGVWQRSHGAWSWSVDYLEYADSIGSSWSITEILKNRDNVFLQDDELVIDYTKTC